ncbi:hypothetical protein SRHO_G00174570 [Serrasalmus rhombeus]
MEAFFQPRKVSIDYSVSHLTARHPQPAIRAASERPVRWRWQKDSAPFCSYQRGADGPPEKEDAAFANKRSAFVPSMALSYCLKVEHVSVSVDGRGLLGFSGTSMLSSALRKATPALSPAASAKWLDQICQLSSWAVLVIASAGASGEAHKDAMS